MRVLVATVVHDPRDARVYARQIGALLEAGHQVTYIAAFTDFGLDGLPGVDAVDIPAARGRRRVAAWRAARRELHGRAHEHDVILLHSPELIMAARGLKHPCIVWDVHEDTAAAVTLKGWLPTPMRTPIARIVRRAERWAERHWNLILAEEAYADRFADVHPIVANSTPVPADVPPSGCDRVVYIGHITRARGGAEILELGRMLHDEVEVHLIGHADEAMMPLLRAAQAAGEVIWHGYLDNSTALSIVQGAAVGLSLLHDEANYRHSRPTKIMEYWAQGVPVVSTPLPLARQMIDASGGGVIVPFADAPAAARAVRELVRDDERRRAIALGGRRWVRDHADWNVDGPRFVSLLAAWAHSPDVIEHGPRDSA